MHVTVVNVRQMLEDSGKSINRRRYGGCENRDKSAGPHRW
jgi:hypothetical protein